MQPAHDLSIAEIKRMMMLPPRAAIENCDEIYSRITTWWKQATTGNGVERVWAKASMTTAAKLIATQYPEVSKELGFLLLLSMEFDT